MKQAELVTRLLALSDETKARVFTAFVQERFPGAPGESPVSILLWGVTTSLNPPDVNAHSLRTLEMWEAWSVAESGGEALLPELELDEADIAYGLARALEHKRAGVEAKKIANRPPFKKVK